MNIAIFASGNGSNAENIFHYFKKQQLPVNVSLIITNNPNAYVIERAKNIQVPVEVFSKDDFYNHPEKIIAQLKKFNIDYIVLAGFLLKIHPEIIRAFPNKIINIHPSLLPKFGGKGMYGDNVHKAVLDSAEKESGITIHFVNEEYDKGKIIAQYKIAVNETDTVDTLAKKIHNLEYTYFPKTIKQIIFNEI
jgi:phosphoribosylglycinamide formyltransferase-1